MEILSLFLDSVMKTDRRYLFYKYESNGSLSKHVSNEDLTWNQRLSICLHAARGLKYLHDDVGRFYRDVKSSNILLDESWDPKIASTSSSFVISNTYGTPGYIDPDYPISGYHNQKSDVYSFGVVLWERDITSLSIEVKRLQIPLQEISLATNGFANKNIITGGVHGKVYKGISETYGQIVVKRLDRRQGQGDHKFKKEIDLLSVYEHENIVSLLGFCDEDDERYLYLHDEVAIQNRIIHRNVKSSNILLNENWKAKISSFGLSIASPANMKSTYLIEDACGTPEYIDPEYANTRYLTEKSDVYSFGVVLCEVLCGRLAHDTSYDEKHQYLTLLVKLHHRTQTLGTIIHSSLRRQINTSSLLTFSNIAYQCLKNVEERPTMKQVVEQLQITLDNQQIQTTPLSVEVKHLQIPLREISLATNGFANKNLITKGGGFGEVYKGKSETYGHMAIKRLDSRKGQGDHEFRIDVDLLSVYKHKNIVSLVGFCDEDSEKILVYKYESNGSLDTQDLTWMQRLHIRLDAARGLRYLHDDVGPQHQIIHRDVKSANILLDKKWNAKISDFGLSRVAPIVMQATYLITNACGTPGYIDPEYINTFYLTKKSDVYSFGVVLFEVLCCRLTFVRSYKDDWRFLTNLVRKHYIRQTLDMVIPSYLRKQISTDSLVTFSNVAYQCLKNGEERPTMKQVVEQLETALDQQL
ncbi:uncharacterized protein LOC143549283 [Bidens hawaiensis]|uniref:uncharacterized protein LOC143549283 n=1 Tax=Bidens hawaiensis TaxID=980011 RepID=UPI004049B0E9